MLSYNLINNNKKETIVFLHGVGGNNKCFKYQTDICSKYFNILMIDLHGHGLSKNYKLSNQKKQDLDFIITDIKILLDSLNISKIHIMGLSLGTIVANAFIIKYPSIVISMIQAGAIVSFDNTMKIGCKVFDKLKNILPYMVSYTVMGFLLMPKPIHIKSRSIFVREALKMGKKEFLSWFNLITKFHKQYSMKDYTNNNIPKLYIMGINDSRFLKMIKYYVSIDKNAILVVLNKAGHICNIDNYKDFNIEIDNFFKSQLMFKAI